MLLFDADRGLGEILMLVDTTALPSFEFVTCCASSVQLLMGTLKPQRGVESSRVHLQQCWVPVRFNALLRGVTAPNNLETDGERQIQHSTRTCFIFSSQ